MDIEMNQGGTCLCGNVSLSAKPKSRHVGACHCATCRKWGGGPLLVVDCEALTIEGDEHVGVYSSSDWAERGFCKACGTHLFYRLKEGGGCTRCLWASLTAITTGNWSNRFLSTASRTITLLPSKPGI